MRKEKNNKSKHKLKKRVTFRSFTIQNLFPSGNKFNHKPLMGMTSFAHPPALRPAIHGLD